MCFWSFFQERWRSTLFQIFILWCFFKWNFISCFYLQSEPRLRSNTRFMASQKSRQTTGCGARSTSLWVHRNLFWQLSRNGNWHGSDMSHATTAFQKPSVRAPWKADDAVVGRGNAGGTTSKSGHPCPCQNCPQWLPAGNTERDSLLSRLPCPSDDPIGQGDWTELKNRRLKAAKTQPWTLTFCVWQSLSVMSWALTFCVWQSLSVILWSRPACVTQNSIPS